MSSTLTLGAKRFFPLADVVPLAIQELLSPPPAIPLPWFPRFTELTGGLRKHEMTIICAPTGAGKSAFNASISAQLVLQGISHYVASIETGPIDFGIRLLSALSETELNSGEAFSPERLKKVTDVCMPALQAAKLYISTHENRVSVHEMVKTLETAVESGHVQVAILDNINFFLQPTSSTMEKKEMDDAVHEFVILCKKLPIHVIMVMHPRKTEFARVVSEFDIKGSSTAVQETHNILLLNRPTPKQVEDGKLHKNEREMRISKLRRRGWNVGEKIYFGYQNGRYRECKNQTNRGDE